MTPEYLKIPASQLGEGTPVKVRVLGDMNSVATDLAQTMFEEISASEQSGRGVTMIIPVGPVDQFPILAGMLNSRKVSCRRTVFINMDEYLTDDDQWIPAEHPLSFRGYMQRAFYGLLDRALALPAENQIFPDPSNLSAIQQLIDQRGGVDVCFGGIGINGHLAFNEPPEAKEKVTVERFAALPTRVLDLTRETRTINSVTVGGELAVIPRRAVTVGMKEILASRRLRFYCNRLWQSGVIRRALHGPLTAECPASLLRLHPDASVTVADYVAQPPDIRLR